MRRRDSWLRRERALATCFLLWVPMLLAAAGLEARTTRFRVKYRSEQTIYLEGGAQAGLVVGDRLTVQRDGASIAEIEVAFVAGYSASCRVISESHLVEGGDLALPMATTQALGTVGQDTSSQVMRYGSGPRVIQPRTRISGVLALDFESFSDEGDRELDYDRTQARLSLRGRDLGGLPLSFRVRTRMQEIQRARELSGGVPEDESRDRLYEVSLRYDAPNGRYSFLGGRLGASPFIGIGYLDGLLGEVRAYKSVSVGGFWGSQPDIAELGFESIGQKYGGYLRFSNDHSAAPKRFNVVVGGVREEGDEEISREHVLLETYFHSGSVWSFFQRAEIDLNNDWREELADDTTQLSNLALSVRARMSETVRLVLSYDEFRPYRTERTRLIPADLFDDLARQGVRLRVNVGRPRQLNWNATIGWRDKEDAEDSATSIGFGARHSDVGGGISVGGDVLGYSNLYSEGGVLRLRGAKPLGAGHEIYLALGTRIETGKLHDDDETTDSWGRLGFWVELPANLFGRGEFEYAAGDSLDGSRVTLGLGYRF